MHTYPCILVLSTKQFVASMGLRGRKVEYVKTGRGWGVSSPHLYGPEKNCATHRYDWLLAGRIMENLLKPTAEIPASPQSHDHRWLLVGVQSATLPLAQGVIVMKASMLLPLVEGEQTAAINFAVVPRAGRL